MHPRSVLATLLIVGAVGAAACDAPAGPRPARSLALAPADAMLTLGDSLQLRARLAVRGEWLRATVTLTNVSERMLRVSFGGCAVGLQLHRSADRAGAPAFDWLRRPNPDPGAGGMPWGCTLELTLVEIPAGGSFAGGLAVEVPVARVLSDTLAVGRYFAAAPVYLRAGGRTPTPMEYRVPAGLLDVQP